MSKYISIERDFKGEPTITYWSDIENGDDCVAIKPASTRSAWKDALRIARTLRRFGACRISSNGLTHYIGADPFVVTELSVA